MRRLIDFFTPGGAARPAAVFVVLLAVVVLLKGGRFSLFDLRTLCVNVLPLALAALGQYFVVLTNGIDLSLGPIMSVAGTLAATLFDQSIALAIAAALAAGAFAGAMNGVLVVVLRLQPIIATLATMSIWQGVALVVLPSPGGSVPPGLLAALTQGDGLLPAPVILLLLTGVFGRWAIATRFGLHLRAIGGDGAAARASGVPSAPVTFAAYTLAGFLAALGGLYLTIATSSGSPTIGDNFILLSIAAVVLGGVPLVGGRGSPVGVVIGALTLSVIGSLLYFANLSSFYQSLINGVILISVVGLAGLRTWLWSAVGRAA